MQGRRTSLTLTLLPPSVPTSFRTLSLPCASIFHLYRTAVIPKALPQNSAGPKRPREDDA